MLYEDLSKKIIACAFKVHNKMGFGYAESIYEKCLGIELSRASIKYEVQYPINVYYDDIMVGSYFADMFIEEKIMVELKSVSKLVKGHEVQLVNYLTSTKIDVGLLINFGPEKVDVKRKVRVLGNE